MVEDDPQEVTLNTLHGDLKDVREDLKDMHGDLRHLRGDVKEMHGELKDLRGDVKDMHGDLKAGFGEVKSAIADVKATLITGFRGLPTRESSEEMVRLLRENNRLQEERFTRLEDRLREQHLEIQQILRAMVESQRLLLDGQRALLDGQRALHEDIRALIARLDALIKGRGDGSPGA
jgi:predicted  nucleic acid-binding Zn-ribbon protein